MKYVIVLLVIACLCCGCSSNSGKIAEIGSATAVPQSGVVVGEETTSTTVETTMETIDPDHLQAPTIEKITKSRYLAKKYQTPDPMIGFWTLTNTTVSSPLVTFSSDGKGYATALFPGTEFTWRAYGETDSGDALYKINFNDDNTGNSYDVTLYYNSTRDTGTTDATESNQILVRR